jgi:hypothetical protein
MIDILYGVGLLLAIVIGYMAWKYNWKIADIL